MPRKIAVVLPERDEYLPPDSVQYIEGFLFKESIMDPSILRDLEARVPFASPGDSPRDKFRKNIVGLYRTIEFYTHFADHPDFHKIIADDLGWRLETVDFVLKIFFHGRRLYLKSAHSADIISPNASPAARLICALVDDYRKLILTEPDGPRPRPWTDSRIEHVRAIRALWKRHLCESPRALLDSPPSRPPSRPPRPQVTDLTEAQFDAYRPSRRRSRSPFDRDSASESRRQGYRVRRSERKGDFYRPSSPQRRQQVVSELAMENTRAPSIPGLRQPAARQRLFGNTTASGFLDSPQPSTASDVFAPNASRFPITSTHSTTVANAFAQNATQFSAQHPAPTSPLHPFQRFPAQNTPQPCVKLSDIINKALTDARGFAAQAGLNDAARAEVAITVKHLEVLAEYAAKADNLISNAH